MSVALRPMELPDAETFSSWAVDSIFCAHAGWAHAAAVDEAVAWWRTTITAPDPLLLRLTATVGSETVGYVDLHGDTAGARELGFVIGPSSRWGRGLGTAAAEAGLRYGFTELGLETIWAEAVEANIGSLRILRRLGMTPTGPGAPETFLGMPSRYRQFAISRAEWEARHGLTR